MNIMSIINLLTALAKALWAIHQSDLGKTAEQALEEVIHHISPGKPNSPVLSPSAPPAPPVGNDGGTGTEAS